MADLSVLSSVWLVAVVVLWCLYLVLQGFDFGVGMLLGRVRRDHHDRRVALHAIGPTWAANEVWVVIAVVAMFGAFPGWYAAWASGLYLPLVVVLLALIARNLGVELIGKRSDERWRRSWERVVMVASFVAPFCWGLMWTAVVHGLDVRDGEVVGSPLDVFSAYSVLGGLTLVALCRALGAAFLGLRTSEDVRAAAERELRVSAPVAAVLAGGVLAWTALSFSPGVFGLVVMGLCFAALVVMAVAGVAFVAVGANVADGAGEHGSASREVGSCGGGAATGDGDAARDRGRGRGDGEAAVADGGAGTEVEVGPVSARPAAVAFGAGCAAIGLLVVSWFAVLAPEGIADAGGGTGVVLADVVAGDYTLTLMTGLTALLLPLLLGLQVWSYWLFRARITRADVGGHVPTPVEVVGRLAEKVTGGGTSAAASPAADAAIPLEGPGFRRRRKQS